MLVKRRDSQGLATLAVGAGDDAPHDLTLRHSILRWAQAGVTHRARLR